MERVHVGCDGDHRTGACRVDEPPLFRFEKNSISEYQNEFGDERLNRPLTGLRQMRIGGAAILREALQHDLIDNRCVQRRCDHVAPWLAVPATLFEGLNGLCAAWSVGCTL